MKKEMILIADENNVSRNSLKNILSSRYFVVEATNTTQTINYMKINCDVLDLVIMTESIDFKEVLVAKRGLKRDVGLCLSVLNNDSRVVESAKKVGIENYIIRPYNETIVLKLISSLLDSTRESRFLGSGFLNQYNQMIKKNIGLEEKTLGSCRIDFDKQLISNTTGMIKEICGMNKDASFATIIEKISRNLIKEESIEEYIRLFAYKNIAQHFKDEDYSLDRVDIFSINKKAIDVRSKIVNISNVENGQNVALFVLIDEREDYEKAKINAALYKTHYELISLVDLKTLECEVFENNIGSLNFAMENVTYDYLVKEVGKKLFGLDSYNDFEDKVKLGIVKEKLAVVNTYEVTTFKNNSKMEFYQISFRFLDEFKEKVIFYITDITAQSENDVLTDALTYHGFLNKTFDLVKRGFSKLSIVYCECTNYRDIIEYINVDTVVTFLKNLYKIIQNSFLKPYLIGRSVSDSFWILVDGNSIDITRLEEFKKLTIKEKGKSYNLFFKFGVYVIDDLEDNIKSVNIDSYCERAKIACDSIVDDAGQNYAIFDEKMRDEFIIKTTLLNDIKSEQAMNEIEVFYQPIYDIRGRKIHYLEALCRWNHHRFGYIRPDMFIPYLEASGGISELDKIVISKVDAFLSGLEKLKIRIPITVNLSRRDFFNSDLVDSTKEISQKRNKKKHSGMAFEVTESFNIDISKTMSSIIADLKSYNSTILLDDFGDGVSSLKALTSSRFDIIKIYKGLVDDIGYNRLSEVAIESTVSMCHAVGIKVIAEGVEFKEQLEFLKKCGVDYIQGFIYSRPLPSEKVTELLKRN